MVERRALERIAINQLALLYVDGIRGCHPCLVVNFHSAEPRFTHLRITLPPSNLICHWMASKRRSIAAWCGETEIPAASNLSIKATLAHRARLDRAPRQRPFVKLTKAAQPIRLTLKIAARPR